MNAFASSLSELIAAQNAELGSTLEISVAGVTTQCVLEVPNTGQTLMADAFSEDGTSWVQCLSAPFANNPIVFQTPLAIRQKTGSSVDWEKAAQVINTPDINHGCYRFQIGDPTRKG